MLYKEGLATPASVALPFAIDNAAQEWHKRLGAYPWGVHMGNKDARAYWISEFPDRFPSENAPSSLNHNTTIKEETKPDKRDYKFIVSLTSFGDRLRHDAPIVITDILEKQILKPDLVVLTIYKDDARNIPERIRIYERQGKVRIIVSDINLRPHLKYYSAMIEYPETPVITIDDDQYYAPELFSSLYLKWQKHKDCVVANRCHLIKYHNGEALPYQDWELEYKKITYPCDRLFATGVGGVLYPPGIFKKSDFGIDEITRYITTDDIYLKVLEMRKGINVVCLDRYLANSYINSRSATKERLCDQNIQGMQINNRNIRYGGLDIKNYRKVCYSVISGNYDRVIEPDVITSGWQYIMFTDQPSIKTNVWDVRPLPKEIMEDKALNQVKRQRIMKIQPYLFIDYDVCLWVDGNMRIKKDLNKFYEKFKGSQFVVAPHPDRDCIYDEADAIVRYRKDTKQNMAEQQRLYRDDGYPAHAGLCETNIMIRTNTPEVNELMDMWAEWLRKYSHRD